MIYLPGLFPIDTVDQGLDESLLRPRQLRLITPFRRVIFDGWFSMLSHAVKRETSWRCAQERDPKTRRWVVSYTIIRQYG